MSKGKTILVLILVTLILVGIVFVVNRKGNSLVSPALKQDASKQTSVQPSSSPLVPSYNPPKEIKYDSSTDLEKELEDVNPQILDEDFNGL